MTLTRIESFPFDSKFDGYDDNGYPNYDRAVGASIMRTTFAQFFSDGVFGTPADALRISDAGSGLQVAVQPGVVILNGAMGAFDEPMTLTLDDEATQGVVHFAVFLRYDGNDEYRSIYLRTDRSAAGAPVPEPASGPNVRELRLGYIRVPSNATDLSGATIVNEKGTSACPYAAPFVPLDLDALVRDAQEQADEKLLALIDYIASSQALLDAALSGTAAGELQAQIDTLKNRTYLDRDRLMEVINYG